MTFPTKKLGEIITLEYGKPLHASKRSTEGEYPVFGANGIKTYADTFYFDKPSIIIGRKGSAGELALVEVPFWPLDVTYFLMFDDKVIDLKYLYNFFKTLELPKLARGVKPGINRNDVYNISIPLPPLPEQKRIVKILDEVFENIEKAKENTEKNLENAKELFEAELSLFLRKSDFPIKNLGDVCERMEYGSSKKSSKAGDVPVLGMGNIQDGRFIWDKFGFTSDKEEIRKLMLHRDDVLFNRTNSPELVGKSAIFKEDRPAIFAGYLIRVHPRVDILNPDFLNYFLNSRMAKDQGRKVMSSSVHQANISATKLKGYQIPLPPLNQQKVFVVKLGALAVEVKKMNTIYQKKLSDLEELKKSVLKKAFAGEL
jgi:type I restriction enzyme S subunit